MINGDTIMTVLTLLEAKIKPQRAADLTRLLRELLPSTRSFAGCKGVAANLSEDGAGFVLVEHWDSKEAQQKYSAWRVTTDHGKQLRELLDAPPSIRYFNPLEV
jgi:quinol monooxygenase YgiN